MAKFEADPLGANRETIKRYLEAKGYNLTTARGRREAHEHLMRLEASRSLDCPRGQTKKDARVTLTSDDRLQLSMPHCSKKRGPLPPELRQYEMKPGTAETYRRLAKMTRVRARHSDSPDGKAKLLFLADQYDAEGNRLALEE